MFGGNLWNAEGEFVTSTDIQEAEKTSSHRAPAQWRAGYEYINQHAPTGIAKNRANLWIDEARSDLNSLVFDWPRSILEKAVTNKCSQKLTHKSMMFIGASGAGKSPLAMALGFELAHHYTDVLGIQDLLAIENGSDID
eukprot:327545-Amphidinium_carterae.1